MRTGTFLLPIPAHGHGYGHHHHPRYSPGPAGTVYDTYKDRFEPPPSHPSVHSQCFVRRKGMIENIYEHQNDKI